MSHRWNWHEDKKAFLWNNQLQWLKKIDFHVASCIILKNKSHLCESFYMTHIIWVITETRLTSYFRNLFHILDIQFFQFFAKLDLKSCDSSIISQQYFSTRNLLGRKISKLKNSKKRLFSAKRGNIWLWSERALAPASKILDLTFKKVSKVSKMRYLQNSIFKPCQFHSNILSFFKFNQN